MTEVGDSTIERDQNANLSSSERGENFDCCGLASGSNIRTNRAAVQSNTLTIKTKVAPRTSRCNTRAATFDIEPVGNTRPSLTVFIPTHSVRRAGVNARVRDFAAKDAPAITRLALQAWNHYAAEFAQLTGTDDFLRRIGSPESEIEIIVADSRGEVMGFLGYTPAYTQREALFPPEWAVIRILSVSPDSHDPSIGSRLSLACIDRARKARATAVGLCMNPVMRFELPLYLRLGFTLDRCIADQSGEARALFKLSL